MGMRGGCGYGPIMVVFMIALALPACRAEAAFLPSSAIRTGGCARLLASGAARIARTPRTRRPGTHNISNPRFVLVLFPSIHGAAGVGPSVDQID